MDFYMLFEIIPIFFRSNFQTVWYRAPRNLKQRRIARAGSAQAVLVARGRVGSLIVDEVQKVEDERRDTLLCEPLLLANGTAQELKPALAKSSYGLSDFDDVGMHTQLASSVCSGYTVSLIADKASSNVSMAIISVIT